VKKIFIILLLVVSAGAAYFFFIPHDLVVAPTAGQSGLVLPKLAYYSPDVPVAPPLKPPRTPPPGQKEYRSEFYRFQFFYPADLTLKEFDGPESTRTSTFKNQNTGAQFQLFILPYGEQKISEERLKKDLPSGIIASSTTVLIDGSNAASFYSSDQSLGKTHEVWFVGRGFLYEATTYQELGPWMDTILQSWQFL